MFLSLVMVILCVPFMMAIAKLAAFTILISVRVCDRRLVKICSITSSCPGGCIMIICLEGCWVGKECRRKV